MTTMTTTMVYEDSGEDVDDNDVNHYEDRQIGAMRH